MFEKLGKSLDELVKNVSNDVKMTRIDTRTETISAPYPEVSPAELRLEIGVGKLQLTPGGDKLVDGTVTYNVAEWSPEVVTEGGKVTVKQGRGWHVLGGWTDVRNDWALTLGTAKPFALSVAKGVGESDLLLGGVSLTNVVVEAGTGKTAVHFGTPNPTVARSVAIKTGTGSTRIDGLLNANSPLVTVDSGTGEVVLNFTGESITQDIRVKVNAGTGQITVNVGKGVPFRATVNKGFGGVKTRGSVQFAGDRQYETTNYANASGPKITFEINSAIGSVVFNAMDGIDDLFE